MPTPMVLPTITATPKPKPRMRSRCPRRGGAGASITEAKWSPYARCCSRASLGLLPQRSQRRTEIILVRGSGRHFGNGNSCPRFSSVFSVSSVVKLSFGVPTRSMTFKQKFEIDPAVGRSWTLPADVYLDPELLAREKASLFGKTWQIVGRRDQVANAGDYFTTELLGEPLLIARGTDGILRGFYNVCRHRAGPPAEGRGSRKVFRCGYHGW